MTTSLADLIVQETKAAIYSSALSVATTVGLPVTSWQAGDPTRSLYHVLSTTLYYLEQIAARYVASGFLDLAAQITDSSGASDLTWLKLTAYQKYGYTADDATYATCSVTLTNAAGGGPYTVDAQDLVFAKVTDADITYRNTSGGTLLVGPGTTLVVSVACETAGTDGSVAISGLELVTNLGTGVTGTNTTAAVGVDAESATSIVAGCRAKLEALSPNGAAGAYSYVALSATLTGASDITRASVVDSSATGDVTVYVASSSGAASAPDVTLVETALATYATPQCVTLTVSSASAVAITITPTVYVYSTVGATESAVQAAVTTACQTLFASIPIGGDGDDGKVFRSRITSAIFAAYPGYVFDVTYVLPAGDTTLTASQVATVTMGTITVEFEDAP
jgi:hypothetical protein